VHLDLGAVRDWDYYTGPTFELFSADLGFPLGSGGRYDRLLGAFGLEAPATGFVLHVDRCCDAQVRGLGDGEPASPLALGYAPGRDAQALSAAARLRREGFRVAIDLEANPAPPTAAAGTAPPTTAEARAAFARVDEKGELQWSAGGRSGTGIDSLLASGRGSGR